MSFSINKMEKWYYKFSQDITELLTLFTFQKLLLDWPLLAQKLHTTLVISKLGGRSLSASLQTITTTTTISLRSFLHSPSWVIQFLANHSTRWAWLCACFLRTHTLTWWWNELQKKLLQTNKHTSSKRTLIAILIIEIYIYLYAGFFTTTTTFSIREYRRLHNKK